MRTRKKSDGFTLVELIVVVVILSIVMTIAAAQIDGIIPQYALRAASRQIGSFLKIAKDHAVATGKDVYVEFDLPEGTYWMLVPMEKESETKPVAPEPNATGQPQQPQPEPEYVYTRVFFTRMDERMQFVDVILSQDQIIKTGKATMRITPFGVSNHIIINLKNHQESEMSVKLNGFTSALSFYDQHKEAGDILEDE